MNMRLLLAILAVTSICGLACSSGSGGSGGSGGSSGSGGGSGGSSGASGGSSGGSSGSGGGGTQSVHCNRPDTNQCGIFTLLSTDASAMKQQCAQEGGTVVDACPTANLDGCCTIGALEYCYYNGAGAQAQPQCQPGGGTWSATP